MKVTPQRMSGVDLIFTAPPSKSCTHRALIASALAKGTTTIFRPLDADDTRLTATALRKLNVSIVEENRRWIITGCDGRIRNNAGTRLDLDNSGTSLRLLTTLALLCSHPVVLNGSARMQERPIPPLKVGGTLKGGPVTIDGSMSSQFISSILMAAPYAQEAIGVRIPAPPASASYLDITLGVMEAFGAKITRTGYEWFAVSNTHRYTARRYTIEGDYSSASYFFAIAAACGGRVRVNNLIPGSVQGDRRFLDALAAMGCRVTYGKDNVTVERTGPLTGIAFDMSTSPDTVQTLCAVAAVAQGRTTITGIGHLKFKESDRISDTAERLRALGCGVEVAGDSLTIRPAPLHSGTIDPANDHRMAMSFAVIGMAAGGITIENAECTAKSFPGFWEMLQQAGVKI
ncbi:3-phosphoshikimate 1-carboxyvinyltransferase [Methanoregula sp. PtaB.Bin085]|uniref:3-phosphoshikimate 1-carboxyvinyltransferase n=1 Tax=Methanoregula sp. PtaB.Bin085 TaxID=1811680 RepID=UPI0009C9FBA7|nr:3-phosphoshikimate 1-carboxyvinyltransferase [Methanoregula sp. PtaB.Bin085]OPX63460.1 MAG: 3-phosphoshikimate 1-carboxyvinyltransferase [Methanoregula sp. PtaB.Bin085]